MKYVIGVLLLFIVGVLQAQDKPKLKDLLYSGKLKKDSSGVIRSTDDLSTKIDTSTKKEPVVVQQPVSKVDTVKKTTTPVADASVNTTTTTTTSTTTATDVNDAPVTPAPVGVAPKTNTRLWKEYSDSLISWLKNDVLNSKQVKKNTYFMMIDYEIGTDGQVSFLEVTSTPENAFLQSQVKQFIDSTPLKLNPAVDSANQPKKVKRKQQVSITKD